MGRLNNKAALVCLAPSEVSPASACFDLLARLREELESYNNSELELQRETLNAKLHFLKSVSARLLFLSLHHHAGLLLNSRTVMSFQ